MTFLTDPTPGPVTSFSTEDLLHVGIPVRLRYRGFPEYLKWNTSVEAATVETDTIRERVLATTNQFTTRMLSCLDGQAETIQTLCAAKRSLTAYLGYLE